MSSAKLVLHLSAVGVTSNKAFQWGSTRHPLYSTHLLSAFSTMGVFMLVGEGAYCVENKYVASTITVCIIPVLIPCPADVLSTYHRWAQTGESGSIMPLPRSSTEYITM